MQGVTFDFTCVLNITCDSLSVNSADQWFSPGTAVSSTNKTDHHKITEILLKAALNTITPSPP